MEVVEMAQWLRLLAALTEDWGWIPSDALFWPSLAPGPLMVHTLKSKHAYTKLK